MTRPFTLVSHVRTLIVARARAPTGAGLRRTFALRVTPGADNGATGPTVRYTADLLGAGDVVSVDPAMCTHVEPPSGAVGVEPNYCPYVEFADADFPWRYSLDGGSASRVRPWLCLIALKDSEFENLGRAATALPRIRVKDPSASLPELAQSWAWAHAQFRGQTAADLDEGLKRARGDCLARLLCLRALEDMTSYLLALVPVYERGRRAGIGQEGGALAWDALAWDAHSSAPIELPVYARWRFKTSARDDFESLAHRLKPLQVEEFGSVGSTRAVSIERIGAPVDIEEPGLVMRAEGALQSPAFVRGSAEGDDRIRERLARVGNTVLSQSVQSEADDGAAHPDPVISLPVYGARHGSGDRLDAEGGRWFDTVNLDLRFRLGAGAGARIVKRNQEALMQACWEQAEALADQRRQRTLLQVADLITRAVVSKTIARVRPELSLALTTALQGVTATTLGSVTVRQAMTDASLPLGYSTRSARRAFGRKATALVALRVDGAAATVATVASPTIPGDVSVTVRNPRVARTALSLGEGRRARSGPPAPRSGGGFVAQPGVSVDVTTQNMAARPVVSVGAIAATELATAVAQRVVGLPALKAAHHFGESAASALRDRVAGPVLPTGLAPYLKDEDTDLLVPGAADLPDNRVVLLEENRAFLEAVMVGANHEMIHELVWREYPVDLGATVFRRFWEKGVAASDGAYDDIRPMSAWAGALGANPSGSGEPRVVLVVRGDIVRRYPDVIMALDHQPAAVSAGWQSARARPIEPAFNGRLDGETVYFGFDLPAATVRSKVDEYFFMLFEPSGRFRFGLDIAEPNKPDPGARVFPLPSLGGERRERGAYARSARRGRGGAASEGEATTRDELSWAHVGLSRSGYIDVGLPVPVGGVPWGSDRAVDSANIARALFQKPVCVVLPAKDLIHA